MSAAFSDSAQLRELGFFGAIHYLLQSASSPQDSCPEAAQRLAPSVKFHHNPELHFATADLEALQAQGNDGYRIEANFLGLCGANAPIPDYLAQELATLAEPCAAAHDYLDLFHHRFYEQLFLGVTQGDVPFHLTQDPQHQWKQRIACLLGVDLLAQPTLQRLSLPTLFAIAPCLMHSDPSKEILQDALNRILETQFPDICGPPSLWIEDFIGKATPLHSAFHNELGIKNSRLGENCVLGSRVQDPSSEIAVVIEAKSAEQLHKLSPGSFMHQLLSSILHLTLTTTLMVSFELRFEDKAQAHCCLDHAILGQGAQVSQVDLRGAPRMFTAREGPTGQPQTASKRTWVFSQHCPTPRLTPPLPQNTDPTRQRTKIHTASPTKAKV